MQGKERFQQTLKIHRQILEGVTSFRFPIIFSADHLANVGKWVTLSDADVYGRDEIFKD